MEDNKTKAEKSHFRDIGLTIKGLRILLAFSFVATIIGFSVAYMEHRQYTELVEKYDDAVVRLSECEATVEALVNNNIIVYKETAQAVEITEAVTPVEETDSTGHAYTEQTTADKGKSESAVQASEDKQQTEVTTSKVKETSGTYYVTQSGKKYHVSSCSYLNKSKIAITMDRIKAEGYSPCSRCIK